MRETPEENGDKSARGGARDGGGGAGVRAGEELSLRTRLKPRFRGTLLGGAVADALGFPFEGSSRSFMRALGNDVAERFEKHRSGYFPAGQYSDDTQLAIATMEAILESGGVDGQTVANHYVPLWRENRVIGRGDSTTEAIMKLISGKATWENSGVPRGRAGNSAASRAPVVGLWDYDQPERLLEDVATVSRITHRDERALAGAAAVAAAVAYNVTHRELILGEFLDATAKAAAHFHADFGRWLRDFPRYLSMSEDAALDLFASLGLEQNAARGVRDGVSSFVVPTVLVALYFFLRSPTDYLRTVRNCLLVGGDVDTVSAVAGSISGAYNSVEVIPKSLLGSILNRETMLQLADRFHHSKEERRGART